MAILLDSGLFSINAADGSIGVGWKLNFYTTGTSTRRNTYPTEADALAGTNANTNPIILGSDGRLPAIWLVDDDYKGVLTDENDVVKKTMDPVVGPDVLGRLAETAGAGDIGYDTSATYASGTVGRELQKIGTKNLGTIAGGTTVDWTLSKTFSGNASGTTDFRGRVEVTACAGTNNIDTVDQLTGQVELRHTAGAVTNAFSTRNYVRLGYQRNASFSGGNVTSIRVHDAHFANEGDGQINSATCYFADGYDPGDDWSATGTINSSVGFFAGNMGHATKVLGKAYGFSCDNMTAGAPITAAYHSQMQDGTNRYAIYFEGNAVSQFLGKIGIGSATKPVDNLEVFQGVVKFSKGTDKFSNGGFHEMRTSDSDYIAVFSNSHATAPQGLRIRFEHGPNDTSHYFLRLEDGNERAAIWSNGNMVNQNNSYGAISDERLKDGIVDARPQLHDFRQFRFCNYRLKADGPDGPEHLGLIAQEVQKISPGLVFENGDGMLGINYSLLYLKAAKALQEALIVIDDLTARVAKLEAA